MDRGAWQVTEDGVARVGHDLATRERVSFLWTPGPSGKPRSVIQLQRLPFLMLLVLAASQPPFLSPHVCGIPVSFLQALHSWTSSVRLSCLSSKLQHKVTRISKLDLPLLTVHLSFSPHPPLLFF